MAKRRGNNEGTLFQMPNGKWRVQLTLQGHRLSFTAKSRQACQEWIRQTQNQIDDGMTYASAKIKLMNYLEDWLVTEKSVMRPSTWSHYSQLLRMYIAPNIGNITLKDLRTAHIKGLYVQLQNQNVGKPTIRKIHKLMHSAINAAIEDGLMARNPVSFAHPPKEAETERKVLTESQASQFLASIARHRLEALLHLALSTGMRRGELLGLQWENLDWIERTINIEKQLSKPPYSSGLFQPLKTKSSRRIVAIGEPTILVLREHYEQQRLMRLRAGNRWIENGLIFTNSKGGPLCPSHMTRVFKQLLPAGFPQICFHSLRHTAATIMINNNLPVTPVSKQLGHARKSTTYDMYVHSTDKLQREAAELLDSLITPIKLHPNCTQLPSSPQNATEYDEIAVESREIINGDG
jgi:integrase